MDENVKAGIVVNQPKTIEERVEVAKACYSKLGITFTAVIDGIDDAVENAYAAWPDRLYVVDKRGRIAYKGEKGPDGFNPQDMEQALSKICFT